MTPLAFNSPAVSTTETLGTMQEEMRNIDELRKDLYIWNKGVYHYTTYEAFQSIVSNKELWITRYDCLNDPIEIKYSEDLLKTVLKEFSSLNGNIDYDILIQSIRERLRNTYLLSFSTEPDSQLMWSFYSKNGVNFLVDTGKLLESHNLFEVAYGEVIYSKEKQIELLRDFIRLLEQYSNIQNNDSQLISLYNMLTFCFIIFKQEGLNNEREYRYAFIGIVERFKEIGKMICKREKDNREISYVKIPFDLRCIKTVCKSPLNNGLELNDFKAYLAKTPLNIRIEESKLCLR